MRTLWGSQSWLPPALSRRLPGAMEKRSDVGMVSGARVVGRRWAFRRLIWLPSLACVAFTALLLIADNPPRVEVLFTDVTAQAGIRFTHNAGRTGHKYLPETLGAGDRKSTRLNSSH